jgi:hypothetical protein
MALVLKDRVKETSAVVGTGTLTLLGAETGYQSFAVIGDGNTCYYTIQNTDSGFEGEWEAGIGTYTASGTTLSRDTVLSSSNSGSLVVFSAGTKTVFVTYPAERAVALNAATTGLNVGEVPFADADGYIDADDAFQYSPTLNQATAPVFYSTNGISVYSTLISYSYTLPEDTFAVSYSPLATANGVSVTVPSGQTWTIAVNPYV